MGGLATVVALLAANPRSPAYALDPNKVLSQYMQDIWQKKEGLPQNSVNTILQTHDGYVWFGTQEGLVRFDGVKFTVYDRQNTEAFQHNFVWMVVEDRQHRLWAGTRNGLLRMVNGRFTRYATEEGLPHAGIRCLLEDKDGTLWIGTDGGGLARLKGDAVRVWTVQQGLPSNTVTALMLDADGRVWCGTDAGVALVAKDAIFPIQLPELHSLNVRAFLVDRAGKIWIGTWGTGVFVYEAGRLVTSGVLASLKKDFIYGFTEDRDGNLWVATDGGGLVRYTNGRLERFTTADGLPISVVMSLLEDREGNLWVGTGGGGLVRYSDGKFTSFTTSNGLANNMVWSILEDRQGDMWIGTDGGGVTRLRGGSVRTYSARDGLAHDVVWSLYEDRTGRLWVGTRGGGVSVMQDGRLTTYSTVHGLSSNLVRCVLEDREGRIWIGTEGGGLNVLDHGRWRVISTHTGFVNDVIRTMMEDRAGVLWIGTNGGLVRYAGEAFEVYNTDKGLSNDFVRSLYEDEDGCLWVGTFGGGLNRLRDGRLVSMSSRDGLFDDVIFRLVPDGQQHLWMSSNKGVSRIALKDLHDFVDGRNRAIRSISYDESDGMKSSECNAGQAAACRTRDGRLWFATVKGAAVIDPTGFRLNDRPPPVLIEELIVDELRADYTPSIDIEPGNDRFEIHYTGLSFVAPRKVRFRYRLEGFDKEWMEAGGRRVAYYTNLPPGHYTFQVTACNNDGVWNEQPAVMAVTLDPFFYETSGFYIVTGFGLLFAVLIAFRARVKNLDRRRAELERVVREKTRQIADQKEELERALQDLKRTQSQLVQSAKMSSLGQLVAGMAHEINNPITIIHGNLPHLEEHLRDFRRLVTDTERRLSAVELESFRGLKSQVRYDTMMEDAEDIIRSCNLAIDRIKRVILNLRNFSRLEEAELKEVDLHEGLESALSLVLPNHQHAIEIHRGYGPLPRILCYASQMNQVFMNLLLNAVEAILERNRLEQRSEGHIWITTELRPAVAGGGRRQVRIRIRDDGIGVPDTVREQIFDPFFTTKPVGLGTGLGLSISYGIVQKHNGRIYCQSSGGPGAEFIVEIPA